MRFTGYFDKNNQPINDGDRLLDVESNAVFYVQFQANDDMPAVFLEKFIKKRKKMYTPLKWLNLENFVLY